MGQFWLTDIELVDWVFYQRINRRSSLVFGFSSSQNPPQSENITDF